MKSHQRLSRVEARRLPVHTSSQVQVCVRLRPSVKTGQGPNDTCVRGVDAHSLEIINRRNEKETMKYHFDAFYGETATQQDVYMGSVQPLLCHLLEGQNASILAYGPTGAGKTHTMLGSREQPGVIPRAIRDVLQMTRDASGEEWKYSASMSYLEIYQEKVLDLLEPSRQDLPIREDHNHCILVPGLTEREITSFSDFESYFLPASSNRRVASTQLNQRSSRSHAILLVRIRQKQNCSPYVQRTAKLCLIDLAGSEDNRRTGNKGLRLRESGAINSSLFVLSKVVDALNQGQPRVPYRDSKLTRLLQDSLGGSAHSLIIANIAPEKKYYFDTITSLNFAAKSKQVVNKPFMQDPVPEPETAKRPSPYPSDEGSKAKRPRSEEEKPPVVVEKPLSSLLPVENLLPKVAEQLQRIEALEKCHSGAGNLMSPVLNTPRRERLGFLRVLEEVRRDIQHIKEKQQEIEALVLPHQQVEKAQDENSIIVIKKSGKGKRNKVSNANSENKAPSQWEVEVRPDLLARGKESILDLLNTGSVKDIMDLRQIGKKKASSIVSWRHQYGPFKKIEDLGKIDGITAKAVASFVKMNVLSRVGSLE